MSSLMPGFDSWNEVVEELGPRLYRYFSAAMAQENAADLVQETLIRLVRKVEEGAFVSTQGTLAMYAFGLARLVRLEAWKEEAHHSKNEAIEVIENQADVSVPSLEHVVLATERQQRFRQALTVLTPIQRDIVLFHVDKELGFEEIAQLLKIPINTVKSHMHRAKENLARTLKNEEREMLS